MEPNSIILCCLLYLNSISSPNTYTSCEISVIESEHHTQVIAIENDPPLLSYVMCEFGDEAAAIDVENKPCN